MTPTIPGYVLETIVGSGSHAQVWSARRLATGERVAIKWLPGTTARQDESARAESAVLAGLDHPHLIALREFIVGESGCALVMEYAAGGSLGALLRSRRRLTPPEVVAALSPIAAALAHAHDNGVVHGDVSAANILFDADGRSKLADLGVARLAAVRDPRPDLVGTPAYLDPVIAAGSAAFPASDVFSLGAVALHALTGLGPWQRDRNDSVETVLRRAAAAETPDLREDLADSPPAMAAVVQRALEAQPYRRGSAAEFALDLRASIAPRPVTLGAGRLPRNASRPATDAKTGSGEPASSEFVGIPVDLTRLALREPESAQDESLAGHSAWRRRLLICSLGLGAALFAVAMVFGIGTVRAKSPSSRGTTANPLPAPSSTPSPLSDPPLVRAAPVAPATEPVGTSAALGALRRLDADRSAAYAARQPQLLDKVYESADLLALDQRRLLNTVPAGCGLLGLSTVYSELRVLSSSAGTWRVSVSARMESAQLKCPGRPMARVLPSPPVTMRLMLRTGATGIRIAAANQESD